MLYRMKSGCDKSSYTGTKNYLCICCSSGVVTVVVSSLASYPYSPDSRPWSSIQAVPMYLRELSHVNH